MISYLKISSRKTDHREPLYSSLFSLPMLALIVVVVTVVAVALVVVVEGVFIVIIVFVLVTMVGVTVTDRVGGKDCDDSGNGLLKEIEDLVVGIMLGTGLVAIVAWLVSMITIIVIITVMLMTIVVKVWMVILLVPAV